MSSENENMEYLETPEDLEDSEDLEDPEDEDPDDWDDPEDWDEEDEREDRRIRRGYTLLIIILVLLLAFGIYMILHKTKSGENPLPIAAETTEAATLPETEPAETAPAADPASEADTTEDAAEETTEETTEEPETTEDVLPVNTSPSGNIVANVQQLYVRINHTRRIVLQLSGGLKQSDICWSTDDPNVIDLVAGEVTGLQQGTCMVTASYGDDSIHIPVTVRELRVEKGITYVDGLLVVNKSYSLPPDYDPGLLPITEEAFEALSEDAAKEGYDIYIGSPYRSYQFQEKVYNSMVSGYGKEYADALSARPGHSEHQSGYTIDCNSIDNNFAETPAGQWLAAHAHEYGFIIRYPKGKEDITGYAYESWHIRYVGIEHATNMYEQGLTLEEYLDVTSVYDDTEGNETPVVDVPEE